MEIIKEPLSMSLAEWKQEMAELGEKPFRASIIFKWLHQKHAASYEEMTDLSASLREKLQKKVPLFLPVIETVQRAEDQTAKFLIRLSDEKHVECVLMKYRFGYSLCVSSQAGCRMGCRFCASTLAGLERSLFTGEMLGQIYAVERAEGVTISHVVVMGCGEPFDNYDQLMRFLSLLHDQNGHNMSVRNITVSTCGLPAKIKEFADQPLQVTLAVSLHAPNDEIRKKIMRIADAVSMNELMQACRYYTEKTNNRITFEYLLIKELNDSTENAKELASLFERYLQESNDSGRLYHINVIPVNPVKECGFERPSEERIRRFIETLERLRVPVTRRREMGKKIDAACGQLRAKRKTSLTTSLTTSLMTGKEGSDE